MFNAILTALVSGFVAYCLVWILNSSTAINLPFTAMTAAVVTGILVFLASIFG